MIYILWLKEQVHLLVEANGHLLCSHVFMGGGDCVLSEPL